MQEVKITWEFIKLGQFLKFVSVIYSGAQAKEFLAEENVTVNGVREERRGRKLYRDDKVFALNNEFIIK